MVTSSCLIMNDKERWHAQYLDGSHLVIAGIGDQFKKSKEINHTIATRFKWISL